MKTIILVVAVAFAACNSNNSNVNIERVVASTQTPSRAAQQQQQPNAGSRRIRTAELEDLRQQTEVLAGEVRSQEAYDIGNIRGAKWIPVPQVGERTKELARDKMIVTDCS